MTELVGVEALRCQIGLGTDTSRDDELQAMQVAARRRAEVYTGRTLVGDEAEVMSDGDRALVVWAITVLVTSMFEDRAGEMPEPPAFRALLSSLVRYQV